MIERKFIEQGMKKIELEKFVSKQLDKAGFTGLNIVKTPLVTRIVLNVTRPGLAIGKGGQTIKQLTLAIEEKYGINNPQIEIQEIVQPELNAKAMVQKIVGSIQRGFSWRSVSFRSVNDIQRAGAQGVELVLSGKLAGKGARKRKQRVAMGYMKKAGNQVNLVEYAKATAYPKVGGIGVKLRIISPDVVFPDKIDFKETIRLSDYMQEKTQKAEEARTLAEAKPEQEATEKADGKEIEKTESKKTETTEKKTGKKEVKKADAKTEEKPAEQTAEKKDMKKEKNVKTMEKKTEKKEIKKEEKPKATEEKKESAEKTKPEAKKEKADTVEKK